MTDQQTKTGSNAREMIRAIVERVEKLHEERKAVSDDIADVYREARGNGLDAKALKTVVRLRSMDATERKEQEEIVKTYMHALGMLE